mgnify:CR=1 FL=1
MWKGGRAEGDLGQRHVGLARGRAGGAMIVVVLRWASGIHVQALWLSHAAVRLLQTSSRTSSCSSPFPASRLLILGVGLVGVGINYPIPPNFLN